MKQRFFVVVANLKSRKASLAMDKVKKALTAKGIKVEVLEVKNPSRLNNAFQKAIDLKPDVIVLGGGDGTLISGIEYLTKNKYKNDIGLLPLGTANYLARNLNIPLSVKGSVRALLNGEVREIPVGEANNKFFALIFNIGLTQVVSENVSDDLKKKYGQIAYILELIKQAKQHKPFEYRIEFPEQGKTITGITHQILVYNSDINQQLKLVPEHKIEKPTLKVVIGDSGVSKVRLFVGFLTHIITLGRHRPYMKVYETRSLNITTDPVLPVDFDGEPHGQTPSSVKIASQKIRIIC